MADRNEIIRQLMGFAPNPTMVAQTQQSKPRILEGTMPEGPDPHFDAYYKLLESWAPKGQPGDLLILRDKNGNEFWHERDNNYSRGWSWHPKPAPEMM